MATTRIAPGKIYTGEEIIINGKPTKLNYLGQRVYTDTGFLAPTKKQTELEAEAKTAVEEAKAKQEASKKAALGYYEPFRKEIEEMPRELIDPAMREEMEATRRTQLGAYGQTLAGMYGDEYSGVESGRRREIGMGIAGMQADLPIELQLEIAEKNRAAQLGAIGAGVGVAGGMAGVQMAYQYDPGLEYIKSLGYGQGYQQTLGGGGTTTTTTTGGIKRTPTAPSTTAATGFGTGLKKMQVGAMGQFGYTMW